MRSLILLTIAFLVISYYLPNLSSSLINPVGDSINPSNISYNPDPTIKDLANQATMTDQAKQIFYSTNPQIDTDRNLFETHCKAPTTNNTIELGCYTSDNKIYILNISNSQLSSQMVVTASHEMLHAAYNRLGTVEKQKINNEIESELPKIENITLAQEIQNYRLTEPGQRDNELHSILGTEYSQVGSDLENYYSKYFTNRQIIVTDSDKFKGAFIQLENTINSLKSEIQQTRLQMSQDLKQHDIASYNTLVTKMNSLINEYNINVKAYNDLSRSLQGTEQPISRS